MIQFTIESESVIAKLRGKASRLTLALTNKLNAIDVLLQAKIAGEKLQGEILKSHTGTLARSVEVDEAEISGTVLSGGVSAGGGPAFYGKFHEYGTDREYEITPVKGKALAFLIDGKQVFARMVTHPPIMERSFMRSTLAEEQPEIVSGLQGTVNEVAAE